MVRKCHLCDVSICPRVLAGLVGEREAEHLRRRLLSELQHLARVGVAVRCVRSPNATIVSLKRARDAGRALDQIRQDARTMADVGIDRKEVGRSTPYPFSVRYRTHM